MRFSARRTTYMGVAMRSRLEAEAARQFDLRGIPWVYEPRAYADRSGVYLPDFELHSVPHVRSFVEVKPRSVLSDSTSIRTLIRRMEIILSSFGDGEVELTIYGPELNAGLVRSAGKGAWRLRSPLLRQVSAA